MTKLGGKSRRCKAVRDWSLKVRKRDGKCMNCGVLENLQAHHIIPWHTDEKKRLDIENGITYCKKCHNSIEKKGFIPWIAGKKHTQKAILKMKKAKIGYIPWNTGIKKEIPDKKVCKKCELEKKITDFTPQQKGKYVTNICKLCRNKALKEKRTENGHRKCIK